MDFNLKANALGLVLKTIGIEPTLDGLLTAFGFKPADVYDAAKLAQAKAPVLIAWAQKEAPALIKKIEGFDARITVIETRTARMEIMLEELCRKQGLYHGPVEHAPKAQPAQLPDYVETALLDAAGA